MPEWPQQLDFFFKKKSDKLKIHVSLYFPTTEQKLWKVNTFLVTIHILYTTSDP